MRLVVLSLFLVGCGERYDAFGGGELSVTFAGAGDRGFTGTTTAPGAPDVASLKVEVCERDGFGSQLLKFTDDPVTRQVEACGEGTASASLTEATTDTAYTLGFYGDWLHGTTLSDAGAGAARDGASLWIFSPDTDTDTSFWGTWQGSTVQVAVDDVTGTISGTMDFEEEPSVLDTGTLEFTPATWSQQVTVSWAFDTSIRRRERWTMGRRSGGFVPLI